MLVMDGRDVAFGSVSPGSRTGWISYVAVEASARRRGIGRRITEILMAEMDRQPLEQITLSVGSTNVAAVRLYESLGFVRSAPPTVHIKYSRPA